MQIAESVAGRRRIVRHVGSARDEAELGLLMEEARRLLEDDRQGVLDLGVTPQARRVAMVPAPGQPALFGGEPAPGVGRMVPRARTLKTASGLLYDVLAGVYADLGFGALGDEVFRDLVIARVVEPAQLAGRGPGAGGDGPGLGEPVHPQAHAAPLLRRELP